MYLGTHAFILLFGICVSEAGYGIPAASEQDALNDVEAPAYVPSYAKSQQFSGGYSRSGYGGTKTRYTGTKTGYTGTKTGYTGTKTGYTGTKTGYTGTKTGYTGTKTGYPGTKTGYSETRTWNSDSGSAPTYQDLQHNANANQIFAGPKCDPTCQNNGICVDTNTCVCAANFQGKYCEFEKKPCLSYPPLPMNSGRKCNSELCTITCVAGHKFIDGTSVANLRCVDGQWRPTRADLTSVPDCEPECSPPCLNGGVCLSVNTCQCPTEYRGPQCQYSTSVCDFRKLAFNGNYKCKGDDEEFSCSLSCPPGAAASSAFAERYTCLYSTGAYAPQPIPHCVFNDVVVVTPSNYLSGYSSSYYETYYHNGSASHSQTGLGYGRGDAETVEYGRRSQGVKGTNVHIVVQDFTPKGGTCLTWAGVHYKTFDGKIYSFESPCQHVLVQDAKEHEFTVAVKQGSCQRRGYCPLELTIYLGDKPYVLSAGEEEGSVLFRSSRRLLPIPASLPGIRVSTPGDAVLVNLDAVGLAIKWDTNNVVVVEGSVLLWNNTQGLCGRLDGNPGNDFTTKEGAIAKTKSVLASSWQVKKIGDVCDSSPSEPNACAAKSEEIRKKAQQFCTNVFVKEKFRKCSSVMDVTQLLETCQWDYCACTSSLSPEQCACDTVSVYAKECRRLGVPEMKDWRDADTCPMKCTEGKIYKSCGPDVQPSCQFPSPSPSPADPAAAACVEGCFCPAGLLLEAGRCVPRERCPCRLRNKGFEPGSVVKKDCNTCTCQAGSWTCTSVPCGARCGAVGDPHYTTFDGLRYDFMGHCTYTLLQAENVTVEVDNVACSGSISEEMNLAPFKGEGKPSCTKAVNLKYDGVELHLKQGGLVLVNGKEVAALPARVGDLLIRAASSLFLIVQLPNGLDLWWDGNTRVFVDVPPSFHDKTKGLCGTFNLNQKDDFLTPEGDTEQTALAFANKWKTRERCSDAAAAAPEHPCEANVQNKEAAERYCARLMSKLFEPCHWHVSVTPYYEACVYDMCACAGDAARCLCPILGDYAMACARAGVNIQWRYNVKECELPCSGGQEYTVCADSCQRTCADVSLPRCRPSCVEGCACAGGQVLDSNNVCVPVGLCPCFHKGLQFDAGYKEVRAGRRERELCTCVGARWECAPASAADVQRYPPADELRSSCSAARHMEFTTCELAEPLTCKNMHLPPSTTTKECRPGCQCKKGYVLDASSNKCVVATECPCHHGGRSFPDGHEMQEECNKCKCESGKWVCTALQCAGVCGAWGDSHVATFDGREYEFEGVCTYLFAKGSADKTDGFEVQIQNAPCGTTGATCSKSVTLKVGSGPAEEVVQLTRDAPLPDLSKLERIKLRLAGVYVFLDVPSLGVSLQWDRGVRVYVRVDPMWRDRVRGLCGNYNSDSRDDFQKPEGGVAESSALIFADSWKLKPACPKPTEVEDHCRQRPERKEWATTSCGVLKRHPFSLCHSEVPPTPFIAACERDACACDAGGDCACVCAALAAYAHRCVQRGVVFKWRSEERCPIQCDETCATYEPCMSPCPEETCENTHYYQELLPVCQRDTCVEGCKPKEEKKECPKGEIVANSTSKECVPRGKCKPLCMTLPDGRQVLEGEVLEQDACHTCRCSKKQRVCTGQPCSTEAPSVPPIVVTTPHDEPLKCVSGWTPWINRGPPETTADGHSVDKEPLPKLNELQIGQPMCAKQNMTSIKCRTTVNHKSPKETGLDAECSLEKGLVCNEVGNVCPDFEIQVFCQCEEGEEEGRSLPSPPFQCLDSAHPNYPHPTDCSQFYECTPDLLNPRKPHTVLKACAPGLLYSRKLMVCDWPASVTAERPECLASTTSTVAPTPTGPARPPHGSPPGACPPGQLYKECAYPCDRMCEHFKQTVVKRGQCKWGEKCIKGCVDESVGNIKCEFSSRWRDEKTCVPLKDCTCYYEGQLVKPGGVVGEGCRTCQCLEGALHCDSSECASVALPPPGPSHLPMILPEPATRPSTSTPTTPPTPTPTTPPTSTPTTPPTSTPTTPPTPTPTTPPTSTPTTPPTPTASTTLAPLIVKSTVSPPPDCSPERYKSLLWSGEPLPPSSFTASSVHNAHFKPQYAKLNGQAEGDSAGSWNAATQDTDQFIQVELPTPQPIYGVVLQGSPMFDQYVTSYEVMYGDDGHVFSYVQDAKGDRQVFRGPVEHSGALRQLFAAPVEARVLRLRPLTWHDAISVRFDLLGCGELSPTTTTPRPTTLEPLQCTEPLGLAAQLPLESIEVSSNNEDRKYFALTEQRGWRPLYSTPGEWIMFDFTAPRNITGVKTKGGPTGWVTAYSVLYSSDLATFNPVVDSAGAPAVFPGNFDKDTVVTTQFRPPIHARYLKLLPAKWQDAIEMRVEPIGCFEPYPVTTTTPEPLQCTEPLGLAAQLPLESIEVSSNNEDRKYFALTEQRGWRPLYSTPGEWIMFDFTAPRNITGVKTKGGPTGWVTAYSVLYSSDLATFNPVVDSTGAPAVFPGNFDKDTAVTTEFRPPIHARYLKLLPAKWKDAIEMRVEPIGCFEPYPVTTMTPEPLQCTEPLGLAAQLPLESIEVSSNNDDRKYFVLTEQRGWRPLYSTPGEWIMFDFTAPRNITGVKTKGGPTGWVTAYSVLYSSDLATFNPVVDSAGAPAVFPGNFDKDTVVTTQFRPPIHARYLKLLPAKWQDAIEMRVEPIGCFEPYPVTTTTPEPLQCTEPVGLAAQLPLESIEVSSNNDDRKYFALTEQRGWRPLYSTPGEWIMFDFTAPRNITGVKTKGGPTGWVTAYSILYSSDLATFNPVVDSAGAPAVFPGNFDKDTVVTTQFRPPIHARYLKLLPAKWQDAIEMRVEPIGCFEPYPTSPPPRTESPLQPTTQACSLCPGVVSSSCGCHAAPAKYFDGDGCVTRDQCPCVEGFMTYAVGSSFRGTSCDECVCKLGGVADCKPVKECKCAPDLVPKLTSNCECVCEPCPAGTRICPTSKLCLDEARWCDGLQDCPDDERRCPARAAPSVATTVEAPVGTTFVPTVAAVQTTTATPVECEEVKCPPGYLVRLVSASRYTSSSTADLPPPRPRVAYRRYQTGSAKGGYSKGVYSKGGFSKGGFSKGGYGGQSSQLSQSFTLDKAAPPAPTAAPAARPRCQQFKCVPALPPLRPGVARAPQLCSAPTCPPGYSLKLEAVAGANECPQYGCVPPPERPVFCNVTGRTFNTFDGSEYKYDICYHMLARETKFGDWTIILRKKCRVDGCANQLLVSQDDQLILVKPSLMIEYDNFEYSVEQTNEICFQKNSFHISKMGNGLAIKSRKYNFVVLYNTDGDVKVGVYKSHHLNHVDGLCGYFDGAAGNDRRLPGGGQAGSADEFGRAWAKPGLAPRACETRVIPPEKQKRAWALCDVITKEPLSKCGKVLNLEVWRSICLEKLCTCTELVVNGSRRTEEQCRCLLLQALVAECLAASRDLDVAAWRINLNCPAECPPPLVHYDCYSKSCEPACSPSGARQTCAAQPGQCFPGCYCPEGTLRRGDKCVTPQNCLDCACHGQGAPAQYTTFEGDEMPFFGNCTYLASRDRNETGQHKYEVYVSNGPCASRAAASCARAVHVLADKHVVHVTKDPLNKKLVVSVGEAPLYKFPARLDWATVSMPNKQDVLVELHDALVEVTVLYEKMEFGVRLPSHVYAEGTEGLCGVCAGAQEALVTRNGTVTGDVELYGESWQASPAALRRLGQPARECRAPPPPPEPECTPPPPDHNFCYNLLDKDKFGQCLALVDPQPFLEACERELCANVTEPCGALEDYAAACRRRGVCLDWRGALCPKPCEAPFVYRACVDCERSCDNHDELERDPKKCDKKPVEGCFCPEGKVRVENSCIEPTKCFPCDAAREHYAGDEWQEDACTKCTCSKLEGEPAAHVSCTKQSCSVPVCAPAEDLLTTARAQACCPEYLCVKKPQDNPVCDEPKKMECGYGQVLKQRTAPSGCKEFACECKPASECPHIPTDSEVEIMPGMQRVLDTSGCCPRAQLLCRRDTCPARGTCPPHHEPRLVNVTGACCPEYKCELPADKCLVSLEWEAAPRGGERPREKPQTMLKDLDAAWLDGPCRACRCERAPSSPGGGGGGAPSPSPRCAVTSCPALTPGAQFVLEPRPVPFSCCPEAAQVACRAGDTVYRVGESWTNPLDACESYRCVQLEEGRLEKLTTRQACVEDCDPGWKYFPAEPGSAQCCGKCKPVACVCSGVERPAGAAWRSADLCTNYTCVLADGNLQVQTSNESCPEVPEALKKQFVLKEEKPAGTCCRTHEPVACRVGDRVYQEGETWPSSDPCKNFTCARDGTGRLTHAPQQETCASTCAPGWRHVPPPPGTCCGPCRQHQCVTEHGLQDAGSTWKSADNCTTYTCERSGEELLLTSARAPCPDVAACAPEDLVNETCCAVCKEKPAALSTCYPEEIPAQETVGLVRATLRPHGACASAAPVRGFRECRGACRSGTLYNNQTGSHDSQCSCCQATKYSKLTVTLLCADGSEQPHVVASPLECGCRACGDTLATYPANTGYSGVKTGPKAPQKREEYEYDIPEIYARMAPGTRR